MSKKLHPTLKTIKQGQTVYILNPNYNTYEAPTIEKWFVHSHKLPDSPMGEKITKINVKQIKQYINIFGNHELFYSKTRAYKYLDKQLNIYYNSFRN